VFPTSHMPHWHMLQVSPHLPCVVPSLPPAKLDGAHPRGSCTQRRSSPATDGTSLALASRGADFAAMHNQLQRCWSLRSQWGGAQFVCMARGNDRERGAVDLDSL